MPTYSNTGVPPPLIIVGDMPTGGVIMTDRDGGAITAQRLYDARWLVLHQSTPGQALTLPQLYGAAGAAGSYVVAVRNTGTVPVRVEGVQIPAGLTVTEFVWHEVAWLPAGGGGSALLEVGTVSLPGRPAALNDCLLAMDVDITACVETLAEFAGADLGAALEL